MIPYVHLSNLVILSDLKFCRIFAPKSFESMYNQLLFFSRYGPRKAGWALGLTKKTFSIIIAL